MHPCDYCRIDFILDDATCELYFLEVNVLMNLGIKSGFVQSFINDGTFRSYDEIIRYIVELGFGKINN